MAPIAKHHAAEVKDFTLEFPFSSICSKKKKKNHLLQKLLEITVKHSGN